MDVVAQAPKADRAQSYFLKVVQSNSLVITNDKINLSHGSVGPTPSCYCLRGHNRWTCAECCCGPIIEVGTGGDDHDERGEREMPFGVALAPL